MEEWRAVVGYEGIYEVSDEGRVKSLARFARTYQGQRRVSERILKPVANPERYLKVNLFRDGLMEAQFIHVLMLLAFVGPKPDGFVTRHWNGNPQENFLDNLLYGTEKQNASDRIRHGTDHRGIRHPNCKITDAMVAEIRQLPRRQGSKYARAHGISQVLVSRIQLRKAWAHIP